MMIHPRPLQLEEAFLFLSRIQSLVKIILAQIDTYLHPALPFRMEPGDVAVAKVAVPHLFVDHELHDRVAVVMAPPGAIRIMLALLITHDVMDDFPVI